ncbi:hypothetical protein [Chryseobacterium sp. MP_3.2]|uniref:hypothetical protein n=1 Tax=Chryseobacterium sp. MP_3.2 TaxID=3071712 RepID=UPI002DFC4290|nr:hypothetical protein [Chryseobacterium sp. MP_3.2]
MKCFTSTFLAGKQPLFLKATVFDWVINTELALECRRLWRKDSVFQRKYRISIFKAQFEKISE